LHKKCNYNNNRHATQVVILDLSAAFHCVDHICLLLFAMRWGLWLDRLCWWNSADFQQRTPVRKASAATWRPSRVCFRAHSLPADG